MQLQLSMHPLSCDDVTATDCASYSDNSRCDVNSDDGAVQSTVQDLGHVSEYDGSESGV